MSLPMTWRKFATILVYSFLMLLVGRNVAFLPQFSLFTQTRGDQPLFVTKTKQDIQNIIAKANGNYSVYFSDLTDGSSFGINEHEIFTGASINKVQIVTTLYYLENKGKINLDEQITLQQEDIQDYGTGSLRYKKPGSVYSLKTLAKLALQQSDNTAAFIISNRIGVATIQQIIERLGLTQTDMANNKTSLSDMRILFQKIYQDKITTPAKTQELLGFMRDTDIEDRLPALLPKDAVVYHKTADAVGSVHDVGIIEYHGKRFFLGVFTSNVAGKEDTTRVIIAHIAQTVFHAYPLAQ